MKCYQCNQEYDRIATHWTMSECEYPELSDYQKDVVTGILMGDGCVGKGRRNPRLIVSMANKEYLNHISNILDIHSSSVWHEYGPDEAARRMRQQGFRPEAKAKDYKDMWRFSSIQSPEFSQFRQWYSNGGKVFPEEIEMSETILKHWFVCDGSTDFSNTNPLSKISVSNERGNRKKILSYFDSTPIDDVIWSSYDKSVSIRFGVDGTRSLFDYIGRPLPGFEYKWPE